MKKEIALAGKKIFYTVAGKGKPVMLVHGFGETGDVWKNQIEFLKDHFKLIVPDLPGSGQSEIIKDMSMEGMAEVIKAILDKETQPHQTSPKERLPDAQCQLVKDSDKKENFQQSESSQVSPPRRRDLEGAALIGHSMGGYITLSFVRKYSQYLTSFGLFHSSAYPDSEEKKATRKKGIEFIKEHGAFEFLKTITPKLFSPQSNEKNTGLINGFILSMNNFSDASLVSYYEAMMQRPDNTELLIATALPVLFVLGEFDNAIPLQDGLKLSLLPEKSYIHVLHQSGHLGMLEEPNKSNDFLCKFLSETSIT
ncbi:MAG: alpha/beta fold hydrolase [Chitinophagaceae bacterium]